MQSVWIASAAAMDLWKQWLRLNASTCMYMYKVFGYVCYGNSWSGADAFTIILCAIGDPQRMRATATHRIWWGKWRNSTAHTPSCWSAWIIMQLLQIRVFYVLLGWLPCWPGRNSGGYYCIFAPLWCTSYNL